MVLSRSRIRIKISWLLPFLSSVFPAERVMFHSFSFLLPIWVGLLCMATFELSCFGGDASMGCIESEKQALLKFKQGLKDPSSRLSSWVGEYCCNWVGIRCNNKTGHVIGIYLQNPYQAPSSIKSQFLRHATSDDYADFERSCLSGEINPSLLELKYLTYMDLSRNCFGGIKIPRFIGSFRKLRYLDLSVAGFGGKIPHELGNLSTLHYLYLGNYVQYCNAITYDLHADSVEWLSYLSSLQYLYMGGVNLSMASDWLLSINMIPGLQRLYLGYCSLGHMPTSLPIVNFSTLSSLYLSGNMLGPLIPTWMFNLSKLETLYLNSNNFGYSIPTSLGYLCNLRNLCLQSNSLSQDISKFKESFSGCINSSLEYFDFGNNKLSGSLPDWLWQFTNLKRLDLSYNSLSGPIPSSLGRLSSLTYLHLMYNQLNGTIPISLGQLSNLEYLVLAKNFFEGVLSEAHFSNLKKLQYMYISSSSLILNVSSNWVPPFQLEYFAMDHSKLGPKFPAWLQTQKKLMALSLSNASILGNIPKFIWNLSSNIYFIDLSQNSISGSITISIGETTTSLVSLSLSSNNLTGSIPPSICKIPLINLHLSNNHLTNEIPFCIGDLQFLEALDLRNNSLSGDIPSSICHLSLLQSLHLSKNKFSGELPPTLKNCTRLVTLDLDENELTGKIPAWIGERMPHLKFLNMRSNKFEGGIPPQLTLLSELQVLDLAENNLSGAMPTSFGNFSAMAIAGKKNEYIYTNNGVSDLESIWVSWKGSQYEYTSTISLVMYIDLSRNNLYGEIPEEITHLFGLVNLNLSKNHFTGSIPKNIGNLRWIESLDLSSNRLSGVIPPSLWKLTSLSRLNLSYNNLSGRIPSGCQLDILNDESSIYIGNPLLCGPPLLNHCPGDETFEVNPRLVVGKEDKNLSKMQMQSLYLGMGVGFVVGFWIVWCPLLFKRTWRIAYFHFIDDMKDKIYVAIARKMAKFLT